MSQRCQVRWIDCAGNPTPHDAPAAFVATLNSDPDKAFPVCAEHARVVTHGRCHSGPCEHVTRFPGLWTLAPLPPESETTQVSSWAFGSGSFGCLFDHSEGPFESSNHAAEAAAELFELGEAQRDALASDRFLGLPRGAGADYIEIFEVDADSDWESES